MQETVEERLARIEALLMEFRANQNNVTINECKALLEILTKAPATPCEVIILEKIQDGRKSLSVREAMHFSQRSRQTVLDAMRNIADKQPGKYNFRVGDRERNQASMLIVRAVQAKPIDFASACAGKSKIHLNQLAKDNGLEIREAYEQARAFREATNKSWILQEQKDEQVYLVKAK